MTFGQLFFFFVIFLLLYYYLGYFVVLFKFNLCNIFEEHFCIYLKSFLLSIKHVYKQNIYTWHCIYLQL